MNVINDITLWLEQNWGTAVFGSLTIGGIATTAYLLFKQWIGIKLQGTKYEKMWNDSQDTISNLKELYLAEKAKSAEKDSKTVFMEASQTVLMDAMIKMALSSKLDSDDKASIVANVERLKLMAPKEIITEVSKKAEEAVLNVTTEINDNPAQTVYNISENVGSLLDKYTTKKE